MTDYSLLAPGAVLCLWTLIMLFWMAGARLPAMKQLGDRLKSAPPGGRGQDLEGVLPPEVNWKAHNYTHLTEQPVVFYAVITFLTLSGGVTVTTIVLAWAYTLIRIVHSIWQATVNRVPVRFALFLLSTLALLALTVMAVISTLG